MMLSILLVLLAAAPPKTLWEVKTTTTYDVGLVLNADPSTIQKLALSALGPTQITIGRYVAYPTEFDYRRSREYGGTDCIFENWLYELGRRDITAPPLTCPELTEFLKLGDGIVMVTLARTCALTRSVLRGASDPRQLHLSGWTGELVDLTTQLSAFKKNRQG
jgi:hypothetical protein